MVGDILFPCTDKDNRDENFIVDYDGFIVSRTEEFILTLLNKADDIDFEEEFPGLNKYRDVKDIYTEVSLKNIPQLISELKGKEIGAEEAYKIFDEYTNNNTYLFNSLTSTLLDFALYNIVETKYCKSINIVKRDGWEPWEFQRIYKRYGDHVDKIKYFEGDIMSNLDLIPNPTTIFINDTKLLLDISDKFGPDISSNILFIIRNDMTNSTIEDNAVVPIEDDNVKEFLNKVPEGGIARMTVLPFKYEKESTL